MCKTEKEKVARNHIAGILSVYTGKVLTHEVNQALIEQLVESFSVIENYIDEKMEYADDY